MTKTEAEFMNDKIFKHKVRQACNAWILELLYHEFATQENLFSCAEFMNDKIFKHESAASVLRLDFRVTISKMQPKGFVLLRYPGVYITGKQEQNER